MHRKKEHLNFWDWRGTLLNIKLQRQLIVFLRCLILERISTRKKDWHFCRSLTALSLYWRRELIPGLDIYFTAASSFAHYKGDEELNFSQTRVRWFKCKIKGRTSFGCCISFSWTISSLKPWFSFTDITKKRQDQTTTKNNEGLDTEWKGNVILVPKNQMHFIFQWTMNTPLTIEGSSSRRVRSTYKGKKNLPRQSFPTFETSAELRVKWCSFSQWWRGVSERRNHTDWFSIDDHKRFSTQFKCLMNYAM